MATNKYSDIVLQKQKEMKKHFLPSKREVVNSHPDLPKEKCSENQMAKDFVENTNQLFNITNKIRGWQQNQLSLKQYLTRCDDDVDKAIILIAKQFQYINLLPYETSPNEYLMKIICYSVINGLSNNQLKTEMKTEMTRTFVLSYNTMRQKIVKLAQEINNRTQCPVCGARVKRLKSHRRRCKPIPEKIVKIIENLPYRHKLFYEALSKINYNFETFDELFR